MLCTTFTKSPILLRIGPARRALCYSGNHFCCHKMAANRVCYALLAAILRALPHEAAALLDCCWICLCQLELIRLWLEQEGDKMGQGQAGSLFEGVGRLRKAMDLMPELSYPFPKQPPSPLSLLTGALAKSLVQVQGDPVQVGRLT